MELSFLLPIFALVKRIRKIMEEEIKKRLLSILNNEIENEYGYADMPVSYAVAIAPDLSDIVVCFNDKYPWHEAAMEWAVLTSTTYEGISREIKKYIHQTLK